MMIKFKIFKFCFFLKENNPHRYWPWGLRTWDWGVEDFFYVNNINT